MFMPKLAIFNIHLKKINFRHWRSVKKKNVANFGIVNQSMKVMGWYYDNIECHLCTSSYRHLPVKWYICYEELLVSWCVLVNVIVFCNFGYALAQGSHKRHFFL